MTETETNTTPQAATAAPAPKKKTAVGKVIADVENFVVKEARSISGLWNKEEPQIQDALKGASQLVQTIKTEVNENPVVVAYLLRKINPNYTDATLTDMLTKAAGALNIAIDTVQPTLEGTIAALQAHASQLVPDTIEHKSFFTGLFNVIGQLVAPGTDWNKIIILGTYIYNQFIKPKA